MSDVLRERAAGALKRVLAAFVELTPLDTDQGAALRLLGLHLLEGHAPGAFAERGLRPLLDEALARAEVIPCELPPLLDADVGQARIDAWYLRAIRGLPHPGAERRQLRRYLEALDRRGDAAYAWLLGELAAVAGTDVRLPFGERPFREDRTLDLYWLTHRVLLGSKYLASPLDRDQWAWARQELAAAAAGCVEERSVDLGGEIALCLQALGASGEADALVELVLSAIAPDGRAVDPSAPSPGALAAHTTAVALVAVGGAASPG